jgi:hypothetical protein
MLALLWCLPHYCRYLFFFRSHPQLAGLNLSWFPVTIYSFSAVPSLRDLVFVHLLVVCLYLFSLLLISHPFVVTLPPTSLYLSIHCCSLMAISIAIFRTLSRQHTFNLTWGKSSSEEEVSTRK